MRLVPGFVVLTHGGEGVEEAGVGVVLALEDPGDDVLGAGEQRLLVLLRRGGGKFGGVHLRHWNRAGRGGGQIRVRVWR